MIKCKGTLKIQSRDSSCNQQIIACIATCTFCVTESSIFNKISPFWRLKVRRGIFPTFIFSPLSFLFCRDPNFNLNEFLRNLRSELKSWRKVFWRLWGMCHTLYCALCSSHFPVYMHEFCSFHPQDPEFPSIQFKNSTQPFGSFTCCQMPINRFQPLPANQKGCQSRDHRVKTRNETDSKAR